MEITNLLKSLMCNDLIPTVYKYVGTITLTCIKINKPLSIHTHPNGKIYIHNYCHAFSNNREIRTFDPLTNKQECFSFFNASPTCGSVSIDQETGDIYYIKDNYEKDIYTRNINDKLKLKATNQLFESICKYDSMLYIASQLWYVPNQERKIVSYFSNEQPINDSYDIWHDKTPYGKGKEIINMLVSTINNKVTVFSYFTNGCIYKHSPGDLSKIYYYSSDIIQNNKGGGMTMTTKGNLFISRNDGEIRLLKGNSKKIMDLSGMVDDQQKKITNATSIVYDQKSKILYICETSKNCIQRIFICGDEELLV